MKKEIRFGVPTNTVTGTDFSENRPDIGEVLIYDFHANGTATATARVIRVTKSFMYVEGFGKAERSTGRLVDFKTAILRRDPETAKKLHRQTCERRLMFFPYETLPGKTLRALNAILDEHEVQHAEMKRKYMLSLQEPAKHNPNSFNGRDNTRSKKHQQAPEPVKFKSVLEDVKPSWGRKRPKLEDDE